MVKPNQNKIKNLQEQKKKMKERIKQRKQEADKQQQKKIQQQQKKIQQRKKEVQRRIEKEKNKKLEQQRLEQEKKKKLEKKKFGIIYNFTYDAENSINALTNLAFFINRTLDNTLWKKPRDRNKKLFYIFILNSKLGGFTIPKFKNVAIIENYNNDPLPPDNLFMDRFKIEVENIVTVDSSFSGPFINPNPNTFWFDSLPSYNIEELSPIFSKTTPTTIHDINTLLKWENPADEDVLPLPGTNYAIFCHYDENNIIQDYVFTELQCLKKLGYKILFNSTSSKLSNESDLYDLVDKINYIENISVGTEFNILYKSLTELENESVTFDNILFVNDSVMFPTNGLASMRETIINMQIHDIWGHWDEYMPTSKLQFIYSCFYHFKFSVSKDIINYLEEWLPKCNNRTEYINYVEWRMPNYLFSKSHNIGSVIVFNSLNIKNPTFNKIITHSPSVIGRWIFRPETFAIKFKYILYFLNKNSQYLTPQFWYLTRFLYVGENEINYYHKEKSGLYISRNY